MLRKTYIAQPRIRGILQQDFQHHLYRERLPTVCFH